MGRELWRLKRAVLVFFVFLIPHLCRSVPQDKQKIKKNEQKSDAPGVYGEV